MLEIFTNSLWIVVSLIIFLSGLYFSIKLKFIHLNFRAMFRAINEKSDNKESISAFKALMMSLAGRIGVGSLSGIALAVYLGGPGVLFWIWITSLICAPSTFVESVLATIFRRKDKGNIYRGGPFYYMQDGLKNKKIAIVYALVILIAYLGGFLTMQVNTISRCMGEVVHIHPLIVGIVIALLTALTIFGGVKKIANTTSKLVPFMTIFYVFVCFIIIISKINLLPGVFINIINSALNFKTFGIGILTTLLVGMQKGIFSSELGLGTGSIVGAVADTKSPTTNGLVQTFGIHIENIILATLTVLIICLSNYQNILIIDPNGIELTLFSFGEHMGIWGPLFIVITITLFGLATVLTGYYYGESSLKYIKNANKFDLTILKIITLIVIVISSIASSNLLWQIIDISVGIIAIINTYALMKLRKLVVESNKTRSKNYD